MARPSHVLAAALCALAAALAAAGPAQAAPAGKVQFFRAAQSDFDVHTLNPSAAIQAWMRSYYARMRTYAPYFDSRTAWYPNSWSYLDSYAVYGDSDPTPAQYVLRDGQGRKLYIPFGCGGGTCPLQAADIGNPAWRALYISRAQATMNRGAYRGLFVDDVNMEMKVGDGDGNLVAPQDPRTGTAMTEANWQRYMAEFMEEIRAALPGKEIVHNQVWFFAGGQSNPQVRRAIEAADIIEVERGFNDPNINAGAFDTLLSWVDYVHSRGKAVVYDIQAAPSAQVQRYAVATYLLTSAGSDYVGVSHNDTGTTPDDWWPGWETDLGAAAGPRYTWNGLLRRDFDRGMVLVNKPGATTRTVTLPGTLTDQHGAARSTVTLGARDGVALTSTSTPPPADVDPPDTFLVTGPSGTVFWPAASFTFTASESATFRCSLDGAPASPCTSGITYQALRAGAHVFTVTAVDAAGNADPSPATRSFAVAGSADPNEDTIDSDGDTEEVEDGEDDDGEQATKPARKKLTAKVRRLRRVRGGRVVYRVAGTANAKVSLTLSRRGAGRWGRPARATVKASRAGAWRRSFTLRPGRYRLTVKSGSARLPARVFTVRR